jgi:serine/threonine protein kinase
VRSVAHARKARWADQIRKSVQSLHQSGVIWGDGKPDNVLIDANDDAWLIDFGGGWTNG